MNIMKNRKVIVIMICCIVLIGCNHSKTIRHNEEGWNILKEETEKIGKPEWRPMLKYVAELHEKSTHEPEWPFNFEWEEIGPGYIYGPAFGHWDIVHQVIDVMDSYPTHALHQLLNNIQNQEPNGLIPGSIWMPNTKRDSASWSKNKQGHPPLWVFAVDDFIKQTRNDSVLKYFYTPLVRQITWFENNRKAETEGFYYNDILLKLWESGIDRGIRFDDTKDGKFACIDATCHVYYLYEIAAKWSLYLKLDNKYFEKRAQELKKYIQVKLYSEQEGLFFDSWAIKDTSYRSLAFETLFPIVVGAATEKQANRLIDDYLLDTTCFNTVHPISTVGKRDSKFELRMWRGPSWNSMTYWVARGCIEYGREDAALEILEKALDQSSKIFKETGTIWEFYHPFGGNPKSVARKPQTAKNEPCTDYLGHNPLIEMARLYERIK